MSLLFPEVGTVRFIDQLHPRRKTYILIAANIMWLSPETRTVVLLTLVIYFRYMHLRDLAKQDLVCFMLPSGNQSTPIYPNHEHVHGKIIHKYHKYSQMVGFPASYV